MALVKDFIETREDGHTWYDLHSDTEGKAVLQVETGDIYGSVCMRDDDEHTYEECDDPNYNPEENVEENNSTAVVDWEIKKYEE